MSDLTFNVKGESSSASKFVAKARNFQLIIDEPQNLEGTNEGANPVEYILAGLAGCLNVVGHLVAKELDFTLNNLKIEVSGSLNPNRLFGVSDKERAGFKEIKITLLPDTNASIEILVKWLEIVKNRCPIKDNLSNTTPVKVTVTKNYDSA